MFSLARPVVSVALGCASLLTAACSHEDSVADDDAVAFGDDAAAALQPVQAGTQTSTQTCHALSEGTGYYPLPGDSDEDGLRLGGLLGLPAGTGYVPIARSQAGFRAGRVRVAEPDIYGGVEVWVSNYLGLRFGEDTSGSGRWKPAQPAGCDADPTALRAAWDYAPWCAQNKTLQVPQEFDPNSAEDCLFLDIYTPTFDSQVPMPAGGYPVVVWIHGGDLEWGGASAAVSRGNNLASLGVVVVEIQYRLGGFGFFSHDALVGEDGYFHTGNYGILDQQLALQWVQDNIHAYKGDSSNVTLFGISAGSQSVYAHVMSPGSAGLFHRGIASSASPTIQSDETQEFTRDNYLIHAGCKWVDDQAEPLVELTGPQQIACLRSVDTQTLALFNTGKLQAAVDSGFGPGTGVGGSWRPVADGSDAHGPGVFHTMEGPGIDSFRSLYVAGMHNDVAMIIGDTVLERGDSYDDRYAAGTFPTDAVSYAADCKARWGDVSDWICGDYGAYRLDMSPTDSTDLYGTPKDAVIFETGDHFNFCPSAKATTALWQSGSAPIYRYLWAEDEAYHLSQAQYHFGTDWDSWDDSQKTTSVLQMLYWTNFAKTGDVNLPANPGLPYWPRWDESGPFDTSTSNTTIRQRQLIGYPNYGAVTMNGSFGEYNCAYVWDRFDPVCGDGVVDYDEQCDDGNNENTTDDCSNACVGINAGVPTGIGDGECRAGESALTADSDCVACVTNDVNHPGQPWNVCATLPLVDGLGHYCDARSLSCRVDTDGTGQATGGFTYPGVGWGVPGPGPYQ